MGDNYSHYIISYDITKLSWVSYDTPAAPFSEIRVTINFSTKFHHQKLIPKSDRDQDHKLVMIRAEGPISSTVSAYSSAAVVGTTTNIEEMMRKSIEEALGKVPEPLSAAAQYCRREELTQLACNAVLARLGKKQSILGVHLMELDVEVIARYRDVVGGSDGPRQTSCCICLEDFIPGGGDGDGDGDEPLESLPSWHVFHYNCLLSWRIRTRPRFQSCPICRELRGYDFIICI